MFTAGFYHGAMTRLLLTVDTALSWASHARGESWLQNLAAAFDPAKLDLLRDHRLKACFFVDPMPALVYGIEPIRRMVDPILAAGQEVQLHLHPVWQSVAEGVTEGARFELTCFDAEDQLDLIETARDLLVEAGAPRPVAFRSGGYAADVRTLAALLQAGLGFDSSHLPGKCALPLERDLAGSADLGGVIELPVAVHLGSVSGGEAEQALLHSLQARRALVTLAVDGFEPAAGFERLCALLADRADSLPTAHFAELDTGPAAAAGKPLPLHAWRRTRQMVEQALPNALYARSM
ncbi:MAG TPA: polysaccharide deacetylase [Allosphingosinicella sp.]|nr:polysaccharide deacetylase [Allosphingosinicella sp.]